MADGIIMGSLDRDAQEPRLPRLYVDVPASGRHVIQTIPFFGSFFGLGIAARSRFPNGKWADWNLGRECLECSQAAA